MSDEAKRIIEGWLKLDEAKEKAEVEAKRKRFDEPEKDAAEQEDN